ncbi:MAG TPA: hypothetical protein VHZ03_35960, partial [Trebonia sp.]|nr:hypothetical protein [Trebonia sp.]
AIHHLSYYEALDRIPLGAATTVEFSGPFLIAAAGSRRAIDALWTCLALQWLGITAVALASIGASRGTGKQQASTDEP